MSEADDHGAVDVAADGRMGVGVAGADPKDVGPAGRLLLGRDRELERLFGMIDGIRRRAVPSLSVARLESVSRRCSKLSGNGPSGKARQY